MEAGVVGVKEFLEEKWNNQKSGILSCSFIKLTLAHLVTVYTFLYSKCQS